MKLETALAALRFDPTLPLPVLAALAALCLIAVAVAAWRGASGVVWRALAFATLLLWLAGPRLVEETRETLPDVALLVIDDSASMTVGNRAALATAARERIEAEARGLKDIELRTVVVPEAGSEGTQLFTAIDRALTDIPASRLAGVIAITDGQAHDIPATSPFGPAPLHVLIPSAGEQTDRRLRIIEAPGWGIVGKSVVLRLAIEDLGRLSNGLAFGNAARLTIRRDGEPPLIERLPVGPDHAVEIPITRGGPSVIELTVEPLAGEVSEANNRAVVTLNGVRDRLRVLLVSGEPHVGERTWRRLLKADPAVDLVHFTILRPPEKEDFTPITELSLIPFPVRELFQVKIREFDLIILDRFSNRSGVLPPSYLRNIADYVRAGGALLMSAGPEFASPASLAASPLGLVLPARPAGGREGVVETGFRPAVTPLGARHPVTAGLPGADTWGPWYRRLGTAAARGETLMTGDGAPLLILDRVEEGRTALLLSDQIWLWSRGHQGGGPQAELLRRIAHWLMKEPELEENTLLARIDAGKLTLQRRSTDDNPPPAATITDPDGKQTTLPLRPTSPGISEATLPATTPGVWAATDGTRTTYAAAGTANPLEIADLRATATKLAPLAKLSAGSTRFLDPTGAPTLRRTEANRDSAGTTWIGLQRRHDHIVTGIAATPLLPPWLALPLILGLAVAAWRREGK